MADTGELQPGMLLGGCRIVKLIGRGGMGEVYLAEHQVLRKSVAIKTARANLQNQELARERFLKEARLAARVEHPNVITIYDAGELNGLLYIVMQFVKGQDLSQVLKAATAPLDWRQVMTWMRDAAAGLEEVHALGLIHRDIKPHNLMLTHAGRILVMDFGLVREDDPNASVTSGIIGSPAYMSPEQCRSERLDHRSDIYSLGTTAYNLLCGNPPFLEKSVHLVIMKLAQNSVAERLDRVRSDIPAAVAELVARAMAPVREERMPDARTFAVEIDRLLLGVSVPAGAQVGAGLAGSGGSGSSPQGSSLPESSQLDVAARAASAVPGTAPSMETAGSSVRETQRTKVSPAGSPRPTNLVALLASVAVMAGLMAVVGVGWMLIGKPEKSPDPLVVGVSPAPNRETKPPDKAPVATIAVKAEATEPASNVPLRASNTPLSAGETPKAKPEPAREKTEEEMKSAVATTSGRGHPSGVAAGSSSANLKPDAAPTPDEILTSGTTAGQVWNKNSLAIPFRWCPPGTFTMGTPGATDDESPVSVTLTLGFWLAETEVTQGQWERVMGTTPWKNQLNVKEGADYPATYVCHSGESDSAVDFCQKYTESERAAGRLPANWEYRLPTEAQWEYACRAGTVTHYSFGDNDNDLGDHAWFDKNAYDIDEKFAHRVGTKKANGWGLRDMHGNVWEWCADWYGNQLPGGTDPMGVSLVSNRVYRGGGWSRDAANCRAAIRNSSAPSHRSYFRGLRLALSPSGRSAER